jgi:dual specificity protein kinase YAK1
MICRYRVLENLGSGTFGQVFECEVEGSSDKVAIKVIKNQAAYYHQARVEIGILQLLNTQADPYGEYHIVRLKDFFMNRGHLCLVFELLNLNLYELIRRNKFRGLSLSLVRVFVTHILEALTILKKSSIIHCDIKPENILLQDAKTGEVKLIDFGSACFKNKTTYTYIQSRFYRSPEIILGCEYTEAIDMWSLGCVAAELFLGLPLFPAASEFDLLERITETLEDVPRSMLINAKNTSMYYKFTKGTTHSLPVLLSSIEYQALHLKPVAKGKQYFKHTKLHDIINGYPLKPGISESEKLIQIEQRGCFIDFLSKLLQVDPKLRLSPAEALAHPYITGAKPRHIEKDLGRSVRTGLHEQPSAGIPIKAGHSSVYRNREILHRDSSSSYTPAGSIHKIFTYGSSQRSALSGDNTGSLPMPMQTPPSRSLGAKIHVPVCSEPLPVENEEKVVPIMEIPGDEPAFLGSFQPSSVRTFTNLINQFPKEEQEFEDKHVHSNNQDKISEEDENQANSGETEWNLDEDPLWSDTDDAGIAPNTTRGLEKLRI